MDAKTRYILLDFDEQERYETPSKFDYDALENRVVKFVEDLEKHFKVTFTIDNQVQDASFYCDIKIPRELVKSPTSGLSYSVRVSNFGSLATINFRDEYSVETVSAIIEILERHRFTFIDSDDLEEEYDGQFEAFKNILGEKKPTWYMRYFDYL